MMLEHPHPARPDNMTECLQDAYQEAADRRLDMGPAIGTHDSDGGTYELCRVDIDMEFAERKSPTGRVDSILTLDMACTCGRRYELCLRPKG